MERQSPPRDVLAPLVAGEREIVYACDQARVRVDAFRVWPQGLQFEVRTIEQVDLYPPEFDAQSVHVSPTGVGLQISCSWRRLLNPDWAPLPMSPTGGEMSASSDVRRRHFVIWTPVVIDAGLDVRITASWVEIGMDPQAVTLRGDVLTAALTRVV